jgi:DNA polymerase-3 subunit epsilon
LRPARSSATLGRPVELLGAAYGPSVELLGAAYGPPARERRGTVNDEPPSGSPWDLPISEAPFALVDLEMTGLDPQVDRVIEICIVRKRGGRVEDSLETLIDPGPSAIFQTDVHGLGPEALAGAPSFPAVADRVVELLTGSVLVAHAAEWDVAFLEAELARMGRPLRFRHYLDTLTLARRAMWAKSHSLRALAEMLGIDRGTAHRAGDDVRALSQLFDRLLAQLTPGSPRDLWHVRVAERHARPEIVERCVAFADRGEPAMVTYRPSHKPARSFLAIFTDVRTDLDPPRVLGYSLPGRGRFDLRIDRILAVAPPNPKG